MSGSHYSRDKEALQGGNKVMKKEQWKAGSAIRPTRSRVAELLIIRKATGGRGADNMAVPERSE